MTDDLSASLAIIEVALERLDRRVLLGALQEGLPAGAVQGNLAHVGLAATPELERLYGWRNGTSTVGVTLDDIHIFPGFYLLSIEDAVTNYEAFISDPRWSRSWLPVLANGGGDFYVADLTTSGAGAVRHFWIDETEHPVEFLSLGAMFATLAQGYERGTFYLDPDGYLEMDDLAFGDLATELNPDVAYWRDLA